MANEPRRLPPAYRSDIIAAESYLAMMVEAYPQFFTTGERATLAAARGALRGRLAAADEYDRQSAGYLPEGT